MSWDGRRTVWLLALAGAAAAVWPHGRLWIVLAMLVAAELAARRAWRTGNRKPAFALWMVLAAGLALFVIGWRERAAAESDIRGLYAAAPMGFQRRSAVVDGPTAPVSVTIAFAAGEIAAVSFTHGEPPWIGDAQLQALATAVVKAGRLVSPRAGAFGSPVERAGLRALERALSARRTPAWSAATLLLHGEQDGATTRTVPAVLLLLALCWAGLGSAFLGPRSAEGGGPE